MAKKNLNIGNVINVLRSKMVAVKLKIRKYKPADNSVVWELHWLGLKQNGVKTNIPGPWEKDLNDIENVYLKDGAFLVGELDGKVIAMGAFRKKNEDTAEMKRMRVNPEFQGKGFGKMILDELEKRARGMGYKRMILDTSQKWTRARNFYKKNGYEEFDRKQMIVRGEKFSAIYYEKLLV